LPIDEREALELAADKIRAVGASKLAFVLSAQSTTEDNLALAKLAAALGSDRLYLAALGGWEGDDILRSSDNNPNRAGATQAAGGVELGTVADLLADVQSGAVEGVVALGWASEESLENLLPLASMQNVVSLTSHVGPLPAVAAVTIPVADIYEIEGSFVNEKGLMQTFPMVLQPPLGIDPAWKVVADLAAILGADVPFETLQDLRQTLSDAAEAAQ
jgi:NADH-quinone oxidoreductase subunit G